MAAASLAAVLLAAAVLGQAGPGDETAVTAERVTELVAGLSAPTRAERVRAERDLLSLGPAAAALLPAADSPGLPAGPAARAALGRIRAALAAGPPPAPPPSRVNVADLPTAALGETLTALAARTGNRLDASALPPATLAGVSPDLPKLTGPDGTATFWQVLNALADGRFAVGTATDGVLALLPLSEQEPPPTVAAAGVVRVEAGRPTRRPRFGADGELLRVPVRLVAEPRVRPLLARPVGDGLTVTAGGVPLTPFTPAASRTFGFAGGVAAFSADVFAPDASAGPVAVAGGFEVTVVPGTRTVSFEMSEEGVSRAGDGVTVRLDRVRRTAGAVVVAATVLHAADPGAPAFESYQTWRYAVSVRLRTAAGQVVEPTAPPRLTAEGPASLAVTARFPPDAPAAGRVTLTAPAAPVTTASVRWDLPAPRADANQKPSAVEASR